MDKRTIVRVVVAVVATINAVAVMLGGPQDLLQIDEAVAGLIYEAVSAVATIAATAWVGWKNNSFTGPAITADAVKDLLKNGYELTDALSEVINGK